MLYPLSYGRIVFGAQYTIANYSITASFLQVLYWVDEIKNIIKKQEMYALSDFLIMVFVMVSEAVT